MKILINRKPINGPWGGGNLFLSNFCEYFSVKGNKITHRIEDGIDIIFVMNPRYDDLGVSINEALEYKLRNPNTRIIQRINDCDARKNTDDVDRMLLECSKHIDSTIFVSEWMKNYFLKKGWACNQNYVLVNGANNLNDSNDCAKIDNNKINIVTHHWSNNYLKGFDIYEKLDEWLTINPEFTFTYIGRDRNTFKNSKTIKPLFGDKLLQEISKYDVYVSASRFDPGPNHIIESISCGIPTYVHTCGGGCVEFAGESHVYKDFDHLKKILKSKKYVKNKNTFYSWNVCMTELKTILEGLV